VNQLRPVTYNLDVEGIDKRVMPVVLQKAGLRREVKAELPAEIRSKGEKAK
jgi:hypothetical protein